VSKVRDSVEDLRTVVVEDSSGNVGIGTSSPSAKIEIRNDVPASTDLDPTAIKLYNDSDGGSAIEFSNAVSGKSKISFGVKGSGGYTDETYLGFSTSLNGGSLLERMRIDSGGIVTTPYQPAWNVALSSAQIISSIGDVILFNKSSGGSNFLSGGVTLNATNGRITLPKSGKYLIVASIRTEAAGAQDGTNVNLRLNGVALTRFYLGSAFNSGGSYMYIEPRPFVVNAQANDYLYYDFDSIPSPIALSGSQNTVVSFSGYLLG